jgi:tetraacyldisaccharide 4'-kinase
MAPSPDKTPKDPAGPLPLFLSGTVGRGLSPLYAYEIGRRNRKFDRGIGVTRLDRPVISVGNLSVGGTGKTPMVRTIISWLIEGGHRPAIAMRGYKGAASTGGSAPSSDEAIEYQRTLPPWGDGSAVPIIAQPDRVAGLRVLFANAAGSRVDCVVLDDGFQHRQLARDLDIVLVDATRSPWQDHLLPRGWLREPVESLGRAGAVVITHAEATGEQAAEALISSVRAAVPGAVCSVTEHGWTGLRESIGTGIADTVHHVGWLSGKKVVAVCAIGNPRAFVESVRSAVAGPAGGGLAGEVILQDHDPYGHAAMRRIGEIARRTDAQVIVTTEKDWAKLRDRNRTGWGVRVVRPTLALKFKAGGDDLRGLVLKAANRG